MAEARELSIEALIRKLRMWQGKCKLTGPCCCPPAVAGGPYCGGFIALMPAGVGDRVLLCCGRIVSA